MAVRDFFRENSHENLKRTSTNEIISDLENFGEFENDIAKFLTMLGFFLARDKIDIEEYIRRRKEFLEEKEVPEVETVLNPIGDKRYPLATVSSEPKEIDLLADQNDNIAILNASNRGLRLTSTERDSINVGDTRLLSWFLYFVFVAEDNIKDREDSFREDQFGITRAYGTTRVIDKGASRERAKNRNPFK